MFLFLATPGHTAERHQPDGAIEVAAEHRRDAQPARVRVHGEQHGLLPRGGPDLRRTGGDGRDVGRERDRAGAGAVVGERHQTGLDAGDRATQPEGSRQ